MKNFEIYKFDNFVLKEEEPVGVLDLSINRRKVSSIDNNLKQLYENIEASLKILLKDNTIEKTRLIKMILGEVSPILLEKESLKIVSEYLTTNFKEFVRQKVLDFFIHPDIIYQVQDKIAELAEKHGYEGQIFLHKDFSIKKCDCRISWAERELKYDSEAEIKRIEKLFLEG